MNFCAIARQNNSVGFPAAAQSFVQGDQVRCHACLAHRKIAFRRIKRALRVEDIEKGNESLSVQVIGHLLGATIGRHRFDQRSIAGFCSLP